MQEGEALTASVLSPLTASLLPLTQTRNKEKDVLLDICSLYAKRGSQHHPYPTLQA